ncbi:carcinoembryonic antigen-related cell adhesion molecule 6-like [Oreochromis niloticus]|uniref:Carcinoembryonic antigen-related cell adhesion molecule 6-like n=1 Tax=Oreochromis niloticus TaxID=8128 RepID=A0A669BV50_ORENI|nr:carcinoembryonic antigen-related cell adhesion molecule 6-like [Oreochromis niloticus]
MHWNQQSKRQRVKDATLEMETALIHLIILGVISGLSEGSGVLPDGPLNAAVGETVMFTTTLTPTETPFLSVVWVFGSKNIITSSTANITGAGYEGRITLFPSTGSLELRSLTVNDIGEYTVRISPAGEPAKTGRTRLEIYERVSNISVTSSSTDLTEFNSSVSLSCSASGSALSFLWLNGSSVVTESDRVHLTDGGSSVVINVTRFDQGSFRCRVANPVSNGASEPVNLNINYGPENTNVVASPSQQYYTTGSDINLTCSVESRPPAQFQWFLNGDQLPDNGSEFRLMDVRMSQSGNYSCETFNSITLISQKSQHSVISVIAPSDPSSGCTAGCITGIVIACFVIVAAAAGGGYYINKKK